LHNLGSLIGGFAELVDISNDSFGNQAFFVGSFGDLDKGRFGSLEVAIARSGAFWAIALLCLYISMDLNFVWLRCRT